ncbi:MULTISPECIES: helix-turn-helix domain-containing protein [unclassified Cupriavidus]|uniref:helix-turn-helix domain-containing protein n=1 Tax=unclassified Cupriavidus TaxID=2640874 RepID=UPI001AEA5C2B|nr:MULTISPECIES: helix-turn-helix domain-containing protein [unclassified Cupriavidus]MBP0633186.1 helix-turn-helix domain-containing protein [Cupriavidus sp. AcVe19-1a]MBP0639647.1 helix-turn-helix domain-containing protein [Cupriavidus sp. AcVe19-6a]
MNFELFPSYDDASHTYPTTALKTASRDGRLAEIAKLARGNHHTTQTQRLAIALKELQAVSTYECRKFLDIYCPPARKFDLVQQGFKIETHWQTVRVESGQMHRVGVYVLV